MKGAYQVDKVGYKVDHLHGKTRKFRKNFLVLPQRDNAFSIAKKSPNFSFFFF